jgi:hypothetical protein
MMAAAEKNLPIVVGGWEGQYHGKHLCLLYYKEPDESHHHEKRN